ncbi:hypothetical protein FPV67DRAFT_618958 [Lyophyllum atratum]|nr:hypothetical protein FPV67DRAFT_618958 [Lyophyllum atratum]
MENIVDLISLRILEAIQDYDLHDALLQTLVNSEADEGTTPITSLSAAVLVIVKAALTEQIKRFAGELDDQVVKVIRKALLDWVVIVTLLNRNADEYIIDIPTLCTLLDRYQRDGNDTGIFVAVDQLYAPVLGIAVTVVNDVLTANGDLTCVEEAPDSPPRTYHWQYQEKLDKVLGDPTLCHQPRRIHKMLTALVGTPEKLGKEVWAHWTERGTELMRMGIGMVLLEDFPGTKMHHLDSMRKLLMSSDVIRALERAVSSKIPPGALCALFRDYLTKNGTLSGVPKLARDIFGRLLPVVYATW